MNPKPLQRNPISPLKGTLTGAFFHRFLLLCCMIRVLSPEAVSSHLAMAPLRVNSPPVCSVCCRAGNVGALIIRIGFWGVRYIIPPKAYSNYSGPYSKWSESATACRALEVVRRDLQQSSTACACPLGPRCVVLWPA